MTRNMIAANKTIFGHLDNFCASKGEAVRNADKPRWIATGSTDKWILKNAILKDFIAFGLARAIVRFDHENRSYLCTVGFDYISPVNGFSELDLGAGLLTALLAEVQPRPRATPAEIRDILEFSDKDSDSKYDGHDAESLASLFAPIRIFMSENLSEEDTWRIFFLLCIEECRHGESWIDERFAITLQTICELELVHIPYRTLCRSIFDVDPATMFLALYRCIEALYELHPVRLTPA